MTLTLGWYSIYQPFHYGKLSQVLAEKKVTQKFKSRQSQNLGPSGWEVEILSTAPIKDHKNIKSLQNRRHNKNFDQLL